MDVKLATILMVICLFVGAVGGIAICEDDVKVIEIPGDEVIKTEYVNNTVEVETIVEVETDHLNDSVELFLEELEEEEDLLTCNEHEYDFDDVEVSKIYESYSVEFDEDEKTVDFKIKLKYKEEDMDSCRNTFEVSVFYDFDEDETEVESQLV